MPIVSLFPDASRAGNTEQEIFEREVAARFGLVPNFFRSEPDAPLVIRELWAFAKSAYLNNPIPSLFKERLFVYLSRFCEARYCITRHCGFLLGLGRAAGDSDVHAMTIGQVIHLLERPVPTEEHAGMALSRLESLSEPIAWPSPETSHDDDLLTAATVLFLQPARAGRAKQALRIALGAESFALLVALLTFIRSAHYWTVMHPEIGLEDDVQALLTEHQELAQLLLVDPEAARCEMGTRLFEELESLRALNERQELKKAKSALEDSARQKDLLIKEVHHRIKNGLQIVASILNLQARMAGPAAIEFRNAADRVAAVAAVHEQLHKFDDVRTVELDRYLTDLCHAIATASTSAGQQWSLIVDAEPLMINTDTAVPLALIVNELVTNAIQHSRPDSGGGRVHVVLKSTSVARFSVSVSDFGDGPPLARSSGDSGLGTRIVESLAQQIHATISRDHGLSGYTVAVTVPKVLYQIPQ